MTVRSPDPIDAEVIAHAPVTQSAWALLFLDGLLLAVASLFAMVQGSLFDREFADVVSGGAWPHASALFPSIAKPAAALARLEGANGAVAAILAMAVAATSYRRAERWAWYAMWALPLQATLDLATLAAYDALTVTSAIWDIAVLALAMFGLLVPYGAFFSSKR